MVDSQYETILSISLTFYALGTSAGDIQRAYEKQKAYRRPLLEVDPEILKDLHDRKRFVNHLSVLDNYPHFQEFFREEIEEKGVKNTVLTEVFANDEAADEIQKRLFGASVASYAFTTNVSSLTYTGFLHGLIYTAFGLEFEQSAIIAEGLAEMACTSTWTKDVIDAVENHIQSATSTEPLTHTDRPLFDIQEKISNTPKVTESARWSDGPLTIRNGVMKRAAPELADLLAGWRVTPDTLRLKAAEVMNFCA